MISRREFLRRASVLAAAGGALPARAFGESRLDAVLRTAPRARFWTSPALAGERCDACHAVTERQRAAGHRHGEGLVRCLLCAHRCALLPGQRGRCRARLNVGGELRSLVYGRPVAVNVDPIEKKPFYHFLPGSAAYSLGTAGCPLRCKFCQNWALSQSSPEDSPTAFVPAAELAAAAARRAPVVAFTYNEATVFAEYLLDVAREGRARKLRPVLVSCGFMNEAPLAEVCGALDAVKIDLKGFGEAFYREVCGAELAPVLRSLKQVARSGVHLEIVNLVVPTLNDSAPMLAALAEWVAGELGPDVPVHFTRFHPDYQLMNLPPTPVSTLEKARETALAKGVRYAYVGNVPGHPGNHTYCASCGKPVIERSGFLVERKTLANGRCGHCRAKLPGVWS